MPASSSVLELLLDEELLLLLLLLLLDDEEADTSSWRSEMPSAMRASSGSSCLSTVSHLALILGLALLVCRQTCMWGNSKPSAGFCNGPCKHDIDQTTVNVWGGISAA